MAPRNAILDQYMVNGQPNMGMRSLSQSEVNLYGEKYVLAPLNGVELALFIAQFGELMSMIGSDERKIMLNRTDQYLIGLRAIKQALGGVAFDGVNAGDTAIGMSLIRPQFMQSNAAPGWGVGNCRLNWNLVLAVANIWQDWIFNGALQPMTAGQTFGFVISHLKCFTTPGPLTTEVRFNVGRSVLMPNDVRALLAADTENDVSIIPLQTMMVIPKASFYARARADAVIGTDNIAFGGLLFGLGRNLKEEVPTWLP